MTFESILALALAVAALAFKPGAGMTFAISRTAALGMAGCYAFIAGVLIISMIFLGIVLTGLTFAKDDLIFVSILIKSLAAVYLIWMGIKGLQKSHFATDFEKDKNVNVWDTFTSALMLTLSNPLTILFFAGILPTLINVEQIRFNDILIIAAVIIIVEIAVDVFYCAPIAYSRRFFDEKMLRRINFVSSIVIILVGLFIGYSALPASELKSLF